jgi:hypothetical protein
MNETTKVVKTRPKYGGRSAGVPNKVTAQAREAIALFVDDNAPRLAEWLEAVAKGDPENDVKPNPAKAFELFQSVIEYHVPKLARTEHTGADDGPIEMVVTWANGK